MITGLVFFYNYVKRRFSVIFLRNTADTVIFCRTQHVPNRKSEEGKINEISQTSYMSSYSYYIACRNCCILQCFRRYIFSRNVLKNNHRDTYYSAWQAL